MHVGAERVEKWNELRRADAAETAAADAISTVAGPNPDAGVSAGVSATPGRCSVAFGWPGVGSAKNASASAPSGCP